MTEEEVLVKITQLEAAVDELRRARIEDKGWVVGEFDSVIQSVNVKAEEIVRCMTILTGENGGNGLCSKVRRVEAEDRVRAEEMTELKAEQRSHYASLRRMMYVLLGAIVAGVIKVIVDEFFP